MMDPEFDDTFCEQLFDKWISDVREEVIGDPFIQHQRPAEVAAAHQEC